MSDPYARMVVLTDDEFGAVAAAMDENGQIIATASSGIDRGVYTVMDEAQVWEATGQLLPAPLWDACADD